MYIIVWEFKVKAGCERDFEKAYGSDGDWARFFKQGDGYIQTTLLRDLNRDRMYTTMDYWKSQEHFETFKSRMKNEYGAIDKQFEKLTESEIFMGSFTENMKDTQR